MSIEWVETEFCKVACCDCREAIPTLESGSIDAVVTDPPYGIGFKYNTHDDTPEGYGEWIWSIIEPAESKCNPGSPIFIWQAMQNCRLWSEWFPRDYRLFSAAKNFVQLRNIAMEYSFDPVIVWWTDGKKYSGNNDCRDFHIANTSSVIQRNRNIEKAHPCPRPFDQVWYIVDRFTRPTGTILDPFMGSGTTAIACIRTGRKFIGCEIDRKYFDIALKRIREAEGEGSLFPPAQAAGPALLFDDAT